MRRVTSIKTYTPDDSSYNMLSKRKTRYVLAESE